MEDACSCEKRRQEETWCHGVSVLLGCVDRKNNTFKTALLFISFILRFAFDMMQPIGHHGGVNNHPTPNPR